MFGPRGDVITALAATVTVARRQKEKDAKGSSPSRAFTGKGLSVKNVEVIGLLMDLQTSS